MITVEWDNKQQSVIRYDFKGLWTWEEFENAVERSFTMTEAVGHTVHAIIHFNGGTRMLGGMVIYLRRKLSVLPKNRGMIIIAGGGHEAKTTVQMLTRIHKQHIHRLVTAKDIQEARKLLAA